MRVGLWPAAASASTDRSTGLRHQRKSTRLAKSQGGAQIPHYLRQPLGPRASAARGGPALLLGQLLFTWSLSSLCVSKWLPQPPPQDPRTPVEVTLPHLGQHTALPVPRRPHRGLVLHQEAGRDGAQHPTRTSRLCVQGPGAPQEPAHCCFLMVVYPKPRGRHSLRLDRGARPRGSRGLEKSSGLCSSFWLVYFVVRPLSTPRL